MIEAMLICTDRRFPRVSSARACPQQERTPLEPKSNIPPGNSPHHARDFANPSRIQPANTGVRTHADLRGILRAGREKNRGRALESVTTAFVFPHCARGTSLAFARVSLTHISPP